MPTGIGKYAHTDTHKATPRIPRILRIPRIPRIPRILRIPRIPRIQTKIKPRTHKDERAHR